MFKKIFIHSLNRYISALVFGIAIIVLNNCLINGWNVLMNYVDAFFIAGASNILIGGLAWIGNTGAYDIFGYVFARKRPNITCLYDYTESKREKREKSKFSFIPWIVVGVFFLLISIILYIVFINIYQ